MITPEDWAEEWLELGDTHLWDMEPEIQVEVLVKWIKERMIGRQLGPWRVRERDLKNLWTSVDGVKKKVKAIIPQMTVPKKDGSQRVVYNYSARPKGGEMYINERVRDGAKHVNFPGIADVATACMMAHYSGTLDLSDAYRQAEVTWHVARGQIYFVSRKWDEGIGWIYSLAMDKRAAMGRSESAEGFTVVLVGFIRGLECLHPERWLMRRNAHNRPEAFGLNEISVDRQIPSKARRDGKTLNDKKKKVSDHPSLNQAGRVFRNFTANKAVSASQSVIDDVLVTDGGIHPTWNPSQEMLTECEDRCNDLIDEALSKGGKGGIGWNEGKTRRASRDQSEFMGWRIDHKNKTLHIPQATLDKYIPLARKLIRERVISIEILEKVIGKIEWTGTVCRHLKACTAALYWLLEDCGVRNKEGKIINGEVIVDLSEGMCLDIKAWLWAMENTNSIKAWRLMRNPDYVPKKRIVWVDAAKDAGFGAVDEFSGQWCSEWWPWWCRDWDQTTKECMGAYCTIFPWKYERKIG